MRVAQHPWLCLLAIMWLEIGCPKPYKLNVCTRLMRLLNEGNEVAMIVKQQISAVQVKGRLPDQIATVATVVGGLVGVGVLAYLGLTLSQVN